LVLIYLQIKESYPGSFFNSASLTISENCQIFRKEDLTLEYELGSGEFGVMYKGQLVSESVVIDCAVKTFKGIQSETHSIICGFKQFARQIHNTYLLERFFIYK